jgi:nucleoside-diphosphate-sugar epimerase
VARRAFLLGGSGQTGRALIPRLRQRGWEVVVASRGERDVPPAVEHVQVDRADTAALERALGSGADVLVDFVAFEQDHAEQLLSLRGLVRSLVVLSSAAVYFEAEGARPEPPGADSFPRLAVPLSERSPTAPPGPQTYATKKSAIERVLLAQDDLPATLLRAGAIHGPWSSWAREWYFVKRALDGRRAIVLAYHGESRFHPISVHNLAELIWLAAERPGRRVLNAGDPNPPTVLGISRAIAAALVHDWVEVLVDEPVGEVGNTFWSTPHPVVLDMTEAEFELGYRPVTTYEQAVPETVRWLVDATKDRPWQEVMPRAAEYMQNSFEYASEDEFLRGLIAVGKPLPGTCDLRSA